MTSGEKTGWSIATVIIVVALTVLWVVGLRTPADRPQIGAAIIAAASGLSVGVVTLTGGLLTAFRTQSLAGRVALSNERRTAYSKFLAASDRYLAAATELKHATEQRDAALAEIECLGEGEGLGEAESDALAKKIQAAVEIVDDANAAMTKHDNDRDEAHDEMRETLSMAVLIASSTSATQLIEYGRSVLGDRDDRHKLRNDLYAVLRKELGVPRPDL